MKLLFIVISVLAGVLNAQQARRIPVQHPQELLDSLHAHTGVTYAQYGQREMHLDLYRPKAAPATLPAIVCIHGGGWYKGERSSMTHLAQALAAHGFVAVTISYRLSGEAKFPAAIHDCKAAVRFLRANAERYGIRTDAIGVTGLSAGGHLAALLATSGGVKALEGTGGNASLSSSVQACMAMGAQSDLQSPRIGQLSSRPDDPFYRTFLGASQSENPGLYAQASPRHHLDKSDPPLAFMAGELDDESTHATETRSDLGKLGIPSGLTLISNAPHAFLGDQRSFDICVKASVEFFRFYLKQGGSPLVITDQHGPEIFPLQWRGGKVSAEADPLNENLRSQSASLIREALSLYPAEVLQRNLDKVFILGGLRFRGVKAGGTRSSRSVYLVAASIDTAPHLTRIFHAEFSSILFRNAAALFDEEAWSKALPEGFAYRGSGVQSIQSGRASKKPDEALMKLGFIHEYAQSSKEEDFNSYAAGLLTGDETFWLGIEKNPAMKMKAELVMAFYRSVHPAFTPEFFRNLRRAT